MGRSRQSGGEHRQQRKTRISRQDSRDGKADEGGRVSSSLSCIELARREEEASADSVELARREEEASAGRETVTRESKGSIVS